ncbi:unnamed protein product [Bursaphelenchus okinawaensis]|uniref:Chromo domain-containing protein n=1 Tax=Bursaphelenchus okinawaensis TaxID=465554 RepID=A0A811JUK4_9BILA|nr:unnamed protein product [Bursaphelenchus okinawaensis]CAG9083934.1 unnamed protein product [Bursaphelenchus okinawaensis]
MASEEVIFTVEKLVGVKVVKGKRLYEVKWSGFDNKDNTWEPEESFIDRTPVEKFERGRAAAVLRKQRANKSRFTDGPVKKKPKKSKVPKKSEKLPKIPKKKEKDVKVEVKAEETPENVEELPEEKVEKAPEEKVEDAPEVSSTGRLITPSLKNRQPPELKMTQKTRKMTVKEEPKEESYVVDAAIPNSQEKRITRRLIKEAMRPEAEKRRKEMIELMAKRVTEMERQYVYNFPKTCYLGKAVKPEDVADFSPTDLIIYERVCEQQEQQELKKKAFELEKQRREEAKKKQQEICQQLILGHEQKTKEYVQEIVERTSRSFKKLKDEYIFSNPTTQCLEVMLVLNTEEGGAAVLKLKQGFSCLFETVPLEMAAEKAPTLLGEYMKDLAENKKRREMLEKLMNEVDGENNGAEVSFEERSVDKDVEEKLEKNQTSMDDSQSSVADEEVVVDKRLRRKRENLPVRIRGKFVSAKKLEYMRKRDANLKLAQATSGQKTCEHVAEASNHQHNTETSEFFEEEQASLNDSTFYEGNTSQDYDNMTLDESMASQGPSSNHLDDEEDMELDEVRNTAESMENDENAQTSAQNQSFHRRLDEQLDKMVEEVDKLVDQAADKREEGDATADVDELLNINDSGNQLSPTKVSDGQND